MKANVSIEVFKQESFQGLEHFNVFMLLQSLSVPEALDESYYIKHVIPRSDETNRVLFEPKPVLKEAQHQLLDFIYSIENYNCPFGDYQRFKEKYALSACATAYRKGFNVVDNARFHIGNEVLMKVDINDFFGSIQVAGMKQMWIELLYYMSYFLVKTRVIPANIDDSEKLQLFTELARKITVLTSLNNQLPQGSPTSGALANLFLVGFDRKVLNFCVRHRLNYSRYSDDMTISGASHELQPGKILHYLNILLRKRGLKLKHAKTKLIRRNNRQVVTGIVVNDKKTAGRAYKRSLRQAMHYLKKFGNEHIQRQHKSAESYLAELNGKINWVLQIEKSDKEFNRYKSELSIIIRFVRQGRLILDAVRYLNSLEERTLQLKATETVTVGDLEWMATDLVAEANQDQGIYTFVRRGKPRTFFSEQAILNVLNAYPGWRLPTESEYKAYFEETKYADRILLGLNAPCDPRYNGYVDVNGFRFFNRMGAYWTSDLSDVPHRKRARNRIGRSVLCVYAKSWNKYLHLSSSAFRLLTPNSDVRVVNNSNPITNSHGFFYDPFSTENFLGEKNLSAGAYAIRLVRDVKVPIEQPNFTWTSDLWNRIASSRFSVNLEKCQINHIPGPALKAWQSSSMLFAQNNLTAFDLEHCSVIKRLDLEQNQLNTFNFSSVYPGLKHLLLKGNPMDETLNIPWKNLFQTLHELSLNTFPETVCSRALPEIYLDALNGEQWIEVRSDSDVDALILSGTPVSHLLVVFTVGTDSFASQTLFSKINQLEPTNLFVRVEPKDAALTALIDQLKMQGAYSEGHVAEIQAYLAQNNWESNPAFEWLKKQISFYPEALSSNAIRNFVLDMSWLPNLYFHGDFNIKPDSYQLLHPGMHPMHAPSTSSVFHRPTYLIKLLGVRIHAELFTDVELFYPLASNGSRVVLRNIHLLLPRNQEHVGELVLVLAGKGERQVERGRLEISFPRAQRLKTILTFVNNQKEIASIVHYPKSISSMPLLGLTLRYDVFVLSLPVETVYKKERINANFALVSRDSKVSDYYHDYLSQDFSEDFHGDNRVLLSRENHLSELKIFPVLQVLEPDYAKDKYETRNKETPYIIRKGLFTKPNGSRDEVLNQIKSGEIQAKHLPKIFRKDKEIMLESIKVNPFTMVFAHKGLKEDADFVLQAMAISLRTLVFLSRDLYLNRNRADALLPKVLDELMRRLEPHEFNFIVYKLSTLIHVKMQEFRSFYFEPRAEFGVASFMSFEQELVDLYDTTRAGMYKPIRTYFLREATHRGFFSRDGYYNDVPTAKKEKKQVKFLDMSFKHKYWDLTFLADFPNLKILKLSGTSIRSTLPVLSALEELYVDGCSWFWNYHEGGDFQRLFPNLKKFYARDTRMVIERQLDAMLAIHPGISFIHVKPRYFSENEHIKQLIEFYEKQGRIIEIPLSDLTESDELPF
ncbi:MAG: reverse transcriptase domain-containing protein [Flavobacteriales bacterium]